MISDRTKLKLLFFILLAAAIAIMIQSIPTIDGYSLPEHLALTTEPEWLQKELTAQP